MDQIKFNEVPGSQGRGWMSEDAVWEIVMMGMGRYRLAHMPKGRHVIGTYKTLGEARDWAAKVNSILPK